MILHYLRNIIKYGLKSEHAFMDEGGNLYLLKCNNLLNSRILDFHIGDEHYNIEFPTNESVVKQFKYFTYLGDL